MGKGKNMRREGFSLVELVFSIIVIAISLMTVPLMLSQGAKSNEFALIQESILAVHTKMGNILSYNWDENTSDFENNFMRAMDVGNGDEELDRLDAPSGSSYEPPRRIGHIVEDLRRRMHDEVTDAGAIGSEIANIDDDIDDFDGGFSSVSAAGSAGQFDYLDSTLSIETKVRYISDDADYSGTTINFDFDVSTTKSDAAHATNIKMIELNATTSGAHADIPFVFRAFSSNIGQSNFYERVK